VRGGQIAISLAERRDRMKVPLPETAWSGSRHTERLSAGRIRPSKGILQPLGAP